jgi:anthranilate phosphoribosyltransferase
MTDFQTLLHQVAEGRSLSRQDAHSAFSLIMSGQCSEVQIAAFLMALRVRGETVDEITGAVDVMRANMVPVNAPSEAMDIVGTGGDGLCSYNISTATALLVAACGVPVAKHGNRSVSSRSGAADVLMALGVQLDKGPRTIEHCLKEAGLGFMFAPQHHSAMKHVGPVRQALKLRTIFNLLGPLSNPASVKRLLLGVFDQKWLEPMALSLRELGAQKALIVHGEDGMDEITLTGSTQAVLLDRGQITPLSFHPRDFGLEPVQPDTLVGGDAETNAEALRQVLANVPSAYRDAVLINAGAALWVADKVSSAQEGYERAKDVLASGQAQETLDRLVQASNSEAI